MAYFFVTLGILSVATACFMAGYRVCKLRENVNDSNVRVAISRFFKELEEGSNDKR